MTSHFIPMLSSTPPPLEECGSFEDDEDQFGDFKAATWTLSDDSPVKKSPPHTDVSTHLESNGHVEALERSSDFIHSKKVINGMRETEEREESEWTAEFHVTESKNETSEQELKGDASQESITDSGNCDSGRHCEGLPLPQVESSNLNSKDDLSIPSMNNFASSDVEDTPSDADCNATSFKVEEVEDLNLGSYCETTEIADGIDPDHRISCDEDDEFADFASVPFPSEFVSEAMPSLPSVEDFADFEQAPFGDFSDSQSEQWADFESGTREEKSTDQEDSSRVQGKINKMLHYAFPKEEELVFESPNILSRQLVGSDDSVSNRMWTKLEDLDCSVSLQYQWNGSRAFQRLLYSLNIDSRNIDIIPPAQFDWSSSGLVNPLDTLQSSSSLLDLDFFVRSSSVSSSAVPTSSLEAEFLGPDVPSRPGVAPALLHQLLKQSKSTMLESSGGRPAQLSEAAVRILDQLPDLSFMRAKVLMFPVRCTLES